MELGGVSVPGRSARNDGAYLLKDLSVFETQLGGLKAFVMVSDSTGDAESGDAAAHLAVKAADAYLASLLLSVASGKSPVIDPVLTLKAIVAEANAAVMSAAAEAGGASIGATFYGALITAHKVWFGSVGGGRGYLLRGDQARELAVDAPASVRAGAEEALAEAQVPDVVQPDVPGTALGHEGVDIEVGSVDLGSGDVVVLVGQTASAVLSGPDVLGISCAACDARVAAAGLADAAAKFDPDHSVTVAVWSADSSLFTPVPVPPAPVPAPVQAPAPGVAAPVPFIAANSDTSSGLRAEKIFLWVTGAWIVVAFLALVVMALLSEPPTSPSTVAVTDPASQGGVGATTSLDATAIADPAGATQAEFPKALVVPENVKGGLWLRKNATTVSGSNLVIALKGGAEVEAVDTAKGRDANGKTQEFYVFKVSDISADQVVETNSHPWPPPKSVKLVYGFAASFE